MFGWLDPLLNPEACLPPKPEVVNDQGAQALLARLEALLQHQLKFAVSGEKRSLLRGQGLDFADLREYTPGDDIRKIDWNVFARTLSPHIREYQEEKQLTLWLVPDCTASMHFGKRCSKFQLATDLAGLFALMAERSGHRLGALLIRDAKPEIIAPKTGMAQVQFIADRMLSAGNWQCEDSLEQDPLPQAFQQLAHLVQKHATVIVFSDFLSLNPGWKSPLGQLSRHSKLIHVVLQDAVEQAVPSGLGLLPLADPETSETALLDTSDLLALSEYRQSFQKRQEQIRRQLETIGTIITAGTDESTAEILLRLLRQSPVRGRAS